MKDILPLSKYPNQPKLIIGLPKLSKLDCSATSRSCSESELDHCQLLRLNRTAFLERWRWNNHHQWSASGFAVTKKKACFADAIFSRTWVDVFAPLDFCGAVPVRAKWSSDGNAANRNRKQVYKGQTGPASYSFVREDDMQLHQLLRRGLDPKESGNNGHTALLWI